MGNSSNILNNRYRLDKKIGEGGFANVFLALDLELGRQVAVKVMEQNWANDRELLARFRNEARAIASLEHPNILAIYDFGIASSAPYIVMPYISGGTFADRMKQGPFTLDEIGFYLAQIGSALDYAHQHNIIHRDVKPSNLLMRQDGQLVLMDFGIAKLLANISQEANTAVLGTVAYMAPEQLQGIVSAASDRYMLGVIFYQMLAGKLPYEGNTSQVMAGHMQLLPTSLAQQPTMHLVHPAVIAALDKVVLKALAKGPADRYPTCQALTATYYKALTADPNKAAGYHSRGKQPNQPDMTGTLLTGNPPVIPLTPPAQASPLRKIENQASPAAPPAQVFPDRTMVAPAQSQAVEPEESDVSEVRFPTIVPPIIATPPAPPSQQPTYNIIATEMPSMAIDRTMANSAGSQPKELAGEHLQFTAFHPRVIPVGTWNTLLVYAYIESALQAIRADVTKFKDELGAHPGEVDAWALNPLTRGTKITIVPKCQGITFNPSNISFTWVEDWHQAKFRFQADRRWTGATANGEITIYADLLIIASLRISLRFVEPSPQPPLGDSRNTVAAPAYLFKRIFTSYSHADTAVVLACRNTYKSLGLDVLIDVDRLRTGENWNPALMSMIENADVFQLFWSERSARSSNVNQEWRYALQHYKGEGFIRPVYWEHPLVPPPKELSHLHFDYVELPKLETSVAPIPVPSPRKKTVLKPPRLLVTTEPDKGFRATFELTGETVTLGRATDNALCVPLSIISRHHAVLHRLNREAEEIGYKIVQQQSINPMRLQGEVVAEKVLENGDIIEIGKRGYAEYIVKLTYQAPEYGFV